MLNFRKMVKIVIAVLLCMATSACNGIATVPPLTETQQVLDTVMPEIKTSANPHSTPPRSSTSTIAPQSSRTLGTTPQPLNTQTALTVQAVDLTATQIASFPVKCDENNPFYSMQSSDGNWLAIQCSDKSSEGLEVISKEGKRWVLTFTKFLSVDFMRDGNAVLGGLYPEHWTSDGKYLYFSTRLNISGGGPCFYGWNIDGLFRINVDDGSVTTTLERIPSSDAFYDIAFSSDGYRFAYEYNYNHLAIVDLRTGEEFAVESGEDNVGNLSWSPDGSQLAYAKCHETIDQTMVEKSSIIVYSPETRTSKKILEVKQTLLRIESQNGDQVLKISKNDFQANRTDYLFFDW